MNKLVKFLMVLIMAVMTQGCMTQTASVTTSSIWSHPAPGGGTVTHVKSEGTYFDSGIQDGFDLNHGGGGYYYGGRYVQPLQLPPIIVNETHIGSSTGNRPVVFKSGGQEHCKDRDGGYNNPPPRNNYQSPILVIIPAPGN